MLTVSDDEEEEEEEEEHNSSTLLQSIPLSPAVRDSISYYFVYHQYMFNTVYCTDALSSGPTSKKPASGGGLHSGQPFVMC